jgi:hypothetical protein
MESALQLVNDHPSQKRAIILLKNNPGLGHLPICIPPSRKHAPKKSVDDEGNGSGVREKFLAGKKTGAALSYIPSDIQTLKQIVRTSHRIVN